MRSRCTFSRSGCPQHGFAIHGAEAEELRDGIEAILSDPQKFGIYERDDESVEWSDVSDALQRLLDKTDARDSLAFLEAGDRKRAVSK